MVPPTSYSTGMPVRAVNGRPTTLSTVSFQLPPQMLTTSAFCARAGGTSGSVSSASSIVTVRRERMTFLPRRSCTAVRTSALCRA